MVAELFAFMLVFMRMATWLDRRPLSASPTMHQYCTIYWRDPRVRVTSGTGAVYRRGRSCCFMVEPSRWCFSSWYNRRSDSIIGRKLNAIFSQLYPPSSRLSKWTIGLLGGKTCHNWPCNDCAKKVTIQFAGKHLAGSMRVSHA